MPQMKRMRLEETDPMVGFGQPAMLPGQTQSAFTKSKRRKYMNLEKVQRIEMSEKAMKEKVEKLENQLAEKDEALKKLEAGKSKAEENLNSAKKIGTLYPNAMDQENLDSESKINLKDENEETRMAQETLVSENKIYFRFREQNLLMLVQIEKLTMEKARLQQSVEAAHITIAKNLDKIQHLEARNNCLKNASEKELMSNLLEENVKLDFSLKEEYMENTNGENDHLFGFDKSQLKLKVVKQENQHAKQFEIEEGQKRSMEEDVKNLEHKLTQKDKHVKNLEHKLAQKDKHVKNLEHELAQKDKYVKKLKHKLAQKDKHVKNLEHELAQKDKYVKKLKQKLLKKTKK